MGTSFFKASKRRSGRRAVGQALSFNKLIHVSQTRRKAAYPNSYAASEGALVGQDGAHNAELEGVVLARAHFPFPNVRQATLIPTLRWKVPPSLRTAHVLPSSTEKPSLWLSTIR